MLSLYVPLKLVRLWRKYFGKYLLPHGTDKVTLGLLQLGFESSVDASSNCPIKETEMRGNEAEWQELDFLSPLIKVEASQNLITNTYLAMSMNEI